MQLFYCENITDGYATLDADESRHAVRVLRLREGDEIDVTDGRGGLFRCRIADADDKACNVEVAEQLPVLNPQLHTLHLMVAPTKNPARMEWLVEKAVEVGVAVSAMKQSLHTWLPRINPAVKLTDWLDAQPSALNPQLKFIAHCEADKPRTPLATTLEPGRDAVVLIGPEGDFSQAEIDAALGAGFLPVSLGPSRLRTETAALYAVTAFNILNEK